jgi:hypothetical protein
LVKVAITLAQTVALAALDGMEMGKMVRVEQILEVNRQQTNLLVV